MKYRLDQRLVELKLVPTRSQAESWIKLGKVTVNGKVITKAGTPVFASSKVLLETDEQYVSRAGLKLSSVAALLELDFANKTVLDVGSSTGGFTDFALQHGTRKVYAIDVGTEQLHPSLRNDSRIDLREKTDIRDVHELPDQIDIVVIDVSFISLREILPAVMRLSNLKTQIVAMVKPQFEAGREQVSKGVIKNDRIRRDILKSFEAWAKSYFVIQDKADSGVAGATGNRERFYLLSLIFKQS